MDADTLLDGRRRRCGGDHLHPLRSEPDAAPARIVRRVATDARSQWALFATYSYHGCITDRDGETLELEADHAEIQYAIRDLKYGVGLNHLPSGPLRANGAWLAVQVIAHNLARWTARHRPSGDHQDPPAAVLLPRRTAHPFGAPPSPALALGKPVQ